MLDFEDQKFPTTVKVLIRWECVFHCFWDYDEIKGLNAGHALWRAKQNWPNAKTIEAI